MGNKMIKIQFYSLLHTNIFLIFYVILWNLFKTYCQNSTTEDDPFTGKAHFALAL